MPSGLPPDGYQRNWTPEGIEKLRKTIQKNRPWEQSTGPRTPEGKAIVRQNAIFFGYRIRDPKIVTDPITSVHGIQERFRQEILPPARDLERLWEESLISTR